METCQNVNVKIFSTELLTSIPLRLLGHLYIASFRWWTCFASLGGIFLKSALCNTESPSQGLVITLGALLLVIFVAVESLRHSTRTKRSGPLAWGGVTVQFTWLGSADMLDSGNTQFSAPRSIAGFCVGPQAISPAPRKLPWRARIISTNISGKW